MTCLLCARDAYCRELCRTHYTRWRRQGKPEPLAEWAARGGHLLRPCTVCGTPHHAARGKHTCSAECEQVRNRARWRANLPPEKKRAIIAARRQRRRDDPEWAAAIDRRKHARIKADPEKYARVRAAARAHYRRHATKIQARRRARLAKLSTPELAELRRLMSGYTQRWRERHAEEYQDFQREYRRRRRLTKLADDVTALGGLAERLDAPPVQRQCVECGGPIVGRKAAALVCSPECRRRRTLKLLYPPRPRPCHVCGTIFDDPTSARACSPECKRARRAQQKREARDGKETE